LYISRARISSVIAGRRSRWPPTIVRVQDDFEICVGGANTLRVHASVTNRDSNATRASLVVIRDDSTDDELWLSWEDAAPLGQFLLSCARKHQDHADTQRPNAFDVADTDDALGIRISAKDARSGAVTVPREDTTALSRFVIRAADAVSMIERLDTMNEAPEPEAPHSWA